MAKRNKIDALSIEGFQSIKKLEDFELNNLNVLIGANGAGKSNFISYFRMLNELVQQRLQTWVSKRGGAERLLSFGVKETQQLSSFLLFGRNGYEFTLEPTDDGGFVFTDENLFFDGDYKDKWTSLGSGHQEAHLKDEFEETNSLIAEYCYKSISSWKIFHFHDTSDTAGMKRWVSVDDAEYLRSDASNLAAYLYKLRRHDRETYTQIRKVVQLAIPFFDDFVLKPQSIDSGEDKQIRLLWRQQDNDYNLWPSQLSDGSLRFICLATVLLQPDPPSTIIIDEPELGLHPYAITLIGSLMRSASTQAQLIVSTQSVPLLNEFTIDDLIVVERENGESIFKRLNEDDFKIWLEDYSVGELWEKNILGGRP